MLRLLTLAPQPWGCSLGGHRETEARSPVVVPVTDRWPPVGKGTAAHWHLAYKRENVSRFHQPMGRATESP